MRYLMCTGLAQSYYVVLRRSCRHAAGPQPEVMAVPLRHTPTSNFPKTLRAFVPRSQWRFEWPL